MSPHPLLSLRHQKGQLKKGGGNVAILGKLLAAPGVHFNEKTMWGMTPIMLAIAHGQTDAAQMIADVDKVNLQVKKSFETKAGGDGHWMDPNRFDWETLEQFNDKYNVRQARKKILLIATLSPIIS